jgi:hypothetical protein
MRSSQNSEIFSSIIRFYYFHYSLNRISLWQAFYFFFSCCLSRFRSFVTYKVSPFLISRFIHLRRLFISAFNTVSCTVFCFHSSFASCPVLPLDFHSRLHLFFFNLNYNSGSCLYPTSLSNNP